MAEKTDEDVEREFGDLVNMTPKELEEWLETEESRSVGQSGEDGRESVGHEMGRHIVEIQRTKKGELDDEDRQRMRKVVGYINRHLAQEPSREDKETSKWRYSLKNWGHDPLT